MEGPVSAVHTGALPIPTKNYDALNSPLPPVFGFLQTNPKSAFKKPFPTHRPPSGRITKHCTGPHLQKSSDLVPSRTSTPSSATTAAAGPTATRRTRASISGSVAPGIPGRPLPPPSRPPPHSRPRLVRARSAASACPRSVWTIGIATAAATAAAATAAAAAGVRQQSGRVKTAARRREAAEVSAAEESVQRLAEDLQLGVEAVVL